MTESSNAIVNAALAWKEKAATNAKFKVGDYVLYEGHGEGYRRGRIVSLGGSIGSAGCVVEWVGGGRDSVPYSRLTPCNSAVATNAAYWEKFKVGQEVYYKAGPYQVLGTILSTDGHKYIVKDHKNGRKYEITHADIAYAVNSVAANATASNAGRKTVKVELEIVSFEKGVRSETRYMSVEEVRDLLKRLGKSGDADSFVSRLERQGASDIAINAPDLYAALI